MRARAAWTSSAEVTSTGANTHWLPTSYQRYSTYRQLQTGRHINHAQTGVEIYKRKQESKKERKQAFNQNYKLLKVKLIDIF